ncbi:hypothetical protein OBBRIDRAFT_788136 [Obba rivulosa]|uniref:RlpA-like protein double-psi beta-barrel domain-containing protein n=1 Tax=Obba rivulosa TaxID=1052685 RepID=A0A8E2DTK1_9APHY|nr:hypothetical protein OBBRIDRAFT_788136 [Obba rivulosa]
MYSSRSFFVALFLPFYFFTICSATLHGKLSNAISGRVHPKDILPRRHTSFGKRFDNERFTWYEPGRNACGSVDSPSDWVVAMDSQHYDGGSHCYQMITLSYGGKTVQAKVTDECPGCASGALDLSEALFSHFAPTSQGVIYGEWNF